MAASAYLLCSAAVLLANVSGSDVPNATNDMAVTDCLRPITHPNNDASSATTAVMQPMNMSATTNDSQPPRYQAGGTMANRTFQPMLSKCKNASRYVTSSISPFSSS